MKTRVALIWITLLAIGGCSTPEVLLSKNPEAPPAVDFSGYWNIRKDSEEDRKRVNAAIGRAANGEGIYIPPDDRRGRSTRSGRSSRSSSEEGQVRVFLENGERLKITQTPGGIFISFDRSVVEEFRFGENRMINIGQIDAQRVSGWEGNEYVVETLDKGGMKLTERFALIEGGLVLRRHIVFRDKDSREVEIEQLFDREAG